MSTFQKIWKPILMTSSVFHLFVFFGVMLAGIVELFDIIIFVDYIYAFLFLSLGALASMIFLMDIKFMRDKKRLKRIMDRWERKKTQVALTTIIFILVYVFRLHFNGMLFFAGYEIGFFFLRVASGGYEFFLGIDLASQLYFSLAWIFQWHFWFAIIGIAEAVGRKVGGWFGV
jgi:hypothetical protein